MRFAIDLLSEAFGALVGLFVTLFVVLLILFVAIWDAVVCLRKKWK